MQTVGIFQLITILLVASFANAGRLATGTQIPSPFCEVQGSPFHIYRPASRILQDSGVDTALYCEADEKIYLLSKEAAGHKGFKILGQVVTGSPESIFVPRTPLSDSLVPQFSVAAPLYGIVTETGFYRVQTEKCGNQRELFLIQLRKIKKSFSFGTGTGTGLCISSSSPVSDHGVGDLAPVQVLDYTTQGRSVRIALYTQNPEKITILEVTDESARVIRELDGSDYFQPGPCGSVLRSARLLPNTNRLAVFLSSPGVKILDYAREKIRVRNSFHGALRTNMNCTAAMPVPGRTDPDVTLSTPTRSIYFRTFDFRTNEFRLIRMKY